MSTKQAVVCDLTVFTPEERLTQLQRGRAVLTSAARTEELENETRFFYEGDERLFRDIAAWAAEEHKCCAWLEFTIKIGAPAGDRQNHIELSLAGGGAEGQTMVREGATYYASLVDDEAAVTIISKHEQLTPALAHEIAAGGSAA
jgi:hypothetical protein